MNKIKKIFNSVEERFVFPISRRTWQILSLLAIFVLIASIFYFAFNSTPTTRAKIAVSKEEVAENRVDTSAKNIKTVNECKKKDLLAFTDSLKRLTPNKEWINLGDSSELFQTYIFDEYGNYVMDEYGNFRTKEQRRFIENVLAVPNILENIYRQRGLDTGAICSRIDILKTLNRLSANTTPEYLQSNGLNVYVYILSQKIIVNEALVISAFSFKEKIEGVSQKIGDENMINQYLNYLQYLAENDIDDEKIAIATNLVASHKTISKKSKFTNAEYFDLAKIIFETKLSNEDLKLAMNMFQEEIAYYDDKGLSKSLRRYLGLYNEKLAIAESEKQMKEFDKTAKRSMSMMYGMYAFVSIVGIATILLLFSIQSILKNKYQDKKD